MFLTFLVPQANVEYRREILVLNDGGHAALDWAVKAEGLSASSLDQDAPIVVVMHGLTGCSASMRSLCAEALAFGYRPVVFNKRGHGGVKLATAKLQAFGCVEDLSEAIAHVEKAFPAARLYGIGFSAGSGLLCSYMGEKGDESRLDAAVLVSPGYNALDLFCRGLIHPWYDFLMTQSLKQFLMPHTADLRDVINVDKALKASSIKEFDQHVYMKMHGYADLEAYWLKNNPMRDISSIRRPLLCVNALDDPVCTKENIARAVFVASETNMLVETDVGSHCAFFEGNWRLKSWANTFSMQYLNKVREFQGHPAAKSAMAG